MNIIVLNCLWWNGLINRGSTETHSLASFVVVVLSTEGAHTTLLAQLGALRLSLLPFNQQRTYTARCLSLWPFSRQRTYTARRLSLWRLNQQRQHILTDTAGCGNRFKTFAVILLCVNIIALSCLWWNGRRAESAIRYRAYVAWKVRAFKKK